MQLNRNRPDSRKHQASPIARTTDRRHTRLGSARSRTASEECEEQVSKPINPKLQRGLRIVQRALALLIAVLLLLLSYAATLRVFISQQRQIAQTQLEIQQHEDAITTLEEEIARWKDDEFVKTQARERLGWVLPGEVGYRVIRADGKPYAGGQDIGPAQLPSGEHMTTWWDRMWRSVQTADDPSATEKKEPPQLPQPEEEHP